jgi:hypothetical protein
MHSIGASRTKTSSGFLGVRPDWFFGLCVILTRSGQVFHLFISFWSSGRPRSLPASDIHRSADRVTAPFQRISCHRREMNDDVRHHFLGRPSFPDAIHQADLGGPAVAAASAGWLLQRCVVRRRDSRPSGGAMKMDGMQMLPDQSAKNK